MLSKVIYFSIVEIGYLAFSFALAISYGQWSLEGELQRTLARVICLLIYGYGYFQFFYKKADKNADRTSLFSPTFLVATGLLFGFAIFDSNGVNENAEWQKLFFLSGLIAGFREELFFRGMIQNTLQNRLGYQKGLSWSVLLFALSHIQYIYYGQLHGLLMITCAGIMFGCVYIHSRSILVTGIVHGLYDALLSVDFISYKLDVKLELPLFFALSLLFISLVKEPLTAGYKKS
jgi:membrane protease YdiL (CAAX protease family)